MEKNYFIIIEGRQTGPLSIEELVRHGLTPESIVWREGLPDWTQARNLPELQSVLHPSLQEEESAFGGYAEPQATQTYGNFGQKQTDFGTDNTPRYGQQPPYGQPSCGQNGCEGYGNNQYGRPGYGIPPGRGYTPGPRPYNWMTAAIVATVLGALFSCIGMVFGIIAIVQASNANSAYARGDVYEGDRCNSQAKTWTIVTYCLTGLGVLFCLAMGLFSWTAAMTSLSAI